MTLFRKLRIFTVFTLVIMMMTALTMTVSAQRSTTPEEPVVGIPPIATFGTCEFDVFGPSPRAMRFELRDNCMTTESIVVPLGMTFDGNGHAVTAQDPEGGSFQGGIITNDEPQSGLPKVVNVTDVRIYAGDLKVTCHTGDDRLRGVFLDGVGGTVENVHVVAVNQGGGDSGCQEGNGIEFSNVGGPSVRATITHNTVLNYQKGGIVVNGNIYADISFNEVGESAAQENLAANSVQLGFGAKGNVYRNEVYGNQWLGSSNFAAATFLLYDVEGVTLDTNFVNYLQGNTDVAVYVIGDNNTIAKNRLYDHGSDGPHGDYGIIDCGEDNSFAANLVQGFTIEFYDCYPESRRETSVSLRSLSTTEEEVDPGQPVPFI